MSTHPPTYIEEPRLSGTLLPVVSASTQMGSSSTKFGRLYCQNVQGTPVVVNDSNANPVLTVNDCGMPLNTIPIYVSPSGNSFTVTLPDPTTVPSGYGFKAVIVGRGNGTNTVTFTSPVANKLLGIITSATSATTIAFSAINNNTNLILGSTIANYAYGDYAEFVCYNPGAGATWIIKAVSSGSAAAWTVS